MNQKLGRESNNENGYIVHIFYRISFFGFRNDGTGAE